MGDYHLCQEHYIVGGASKTIESHIMQNFLNLSLKNRLCVVIYGKQDCQCLGMNVIMNKIANKWPIEIHYSEIIKIQSLKTHRSYCVG